MSARTPGPWRASDGRVASRISITSANGIPVAVVPFADPEGKANAEFIVRACNSHDDLIAAVAMVVRGFAYRPGGGPDWYEAARVALAKAGAKPCSP
jgi:hypothetical protein